MPEQKRARIQSFSLYSLHKVFIMTKEKTTKKEAKKEPAKSPTEKKEATKQKKEAMKRQ